MDTNSTWETKFSGFLRRVLNGLVIGIIALSILAQTLAFTMAFTMALGGGPEKVNSGLHLLFGNSSFAVVPGMVLAFLLLLLNLVRSFKDARARIKAAVLLVINLYPVIALALITLVLKNTDPALLKPVARAAPQSREFLAGRDWARENLPVRASACKGELEFIKGCRNYFWEQLAKPKPAGQGRYEGMTTAECKTEVNANYEALEQDFLKNGNPRGAAVTWRRSWGPELLDCENYDKFVENKIMPKAYFRLQGLVDRLNEGKSISDDEKSEVIKDFTEMTKVNDQPYKTAYFSLADEYFERLAGIYKKPVTVYARISCEEYQAKINDMIALDQDRVATMQAMKSGNGVKFDADKYDRLNKERIDMLWEWKYFTDGAKIFGCDIKWK